MTTTPFARALRAAPVGLALLSPATARADIANYEFRLELNEVRLGEVDLPVRLIDKRTGQVVPRAVIFAWRLDMAPDGMEEMTAPAGLQGEEAPGTFRFRARLPMAGRWRLSLAGKVQGEFGTLQDRLTLKAAK